MITMRFGKYKEVPIAELVPYERNARTHSPEQVGQLARSINEFGFTNPLLVDEQNRVIAGHGRLMAATSLGMAVVPCIEVAGLSDAQRRALVLADNKLAMNAGWDVDLLSSELASLKLEGFDLDIVGFSIEELGAFFVDDPTPVDPDDAPPLPTDPVAQPGDVWLLGPHRVMCGDATKLCDMHRLMAGERVDCVWTDPPYNVAYGQKTEHLETAGRGTAHRAILNDSMDDASFKQFLFDAFSVAVDAMKPGAAIYVAHADNEGHNFRTAFLAAGLKLSGCVIWHKDSLVLGRSDYQWQHEPILYGWKKGSAHRWFGGRKNTTVQSLGDHSPFVALPDGRWQVTIGNQTMIVAGDAAVEEVIPSVINEAKPKRNDVHPTMKPVALIERMLKHSARPHDIILDPFGGSGSTLIAAERLGMCARLMELDPAYVDVIVARWEAFTGRTAELQRAEDAA
jgi:DNA modification methylase